MQPPLETLQQAASTIQPLPLSLPPGYHPHDVAVSTDGSLVYGSISIPALNVGEFLDDMMPFWSAPIALVICLFAFWRILRIRARPERFGEPHCRNCGYNLSGSAPSHSQCPECGLNLETRRPRIGRKKWKRLFLPIACIAASLSISTSSWIIPPTHFNLFTRLNWLSPTAKPWVDLAWKTPPLQWHARKYVVLAINTFTGEHRALWPTTATPNRIFPLPNNHLLIANGDGYTSMNAETARVTARLRIDGYEPSLPSTLDPETLPSGEVLLQFANRDRANGPVTGRLVAWSPEKGTSRLIAETPWDLDPNKITGWRGFLLVPGNRPARYVNYSMLGKGTVPTYELRWFDEHGQLLGKTRLPGEALHDIDYLPPSFSQDGSELYLSVSRGAYRHRFDTDAFIAGLNDESFTPDFRFQNAEPQLARSLFGKWRIEGSSTALLLRQAKPRHTRAHLAIPPPHKRLYTAVSPDGSCVAITSLNFNNGVVGPSQIFIWRIPEAPPPAPAALLAEPTAEPPAPSPS